MYGECIDRLNHDQIKESEAEVQLSYHHEQAHQQIVSPKTESKVDKGFIKLPKPQLDQPQDLKMVK